MFHHTPISQSESKKNFGASGKIKFHSLIWSLRVCRVELKFCLRWRSISMKFSDLKIVIATPDDIPDLNDFVQLCYRGDSTRRGWTHEADLIDGPRTTPEQLKSDMSKPGGTFFKGLDRSGNLVGSVFTEKQGDVVFAGMLCVNPDLQRGGLGKKFMSFVEDYAKTLNCRAVRIHVVSRRTELVEWYLRRGFRKTGATVPFPQKEGFDKPMVPLEFFVMQKDL